MGEKEVAEYNRKLKKAIDVVRKAQNSWLLLKSEHLRATIEDINRLIDMNVFSVDIAKSREMDALAMGYLLYARENLGYEEGILPISEKEEG